MVALLVVGVVLVWLALPLLVVGVGHAYDRWRGDRP